MLRLTLAVALLLWGLIAPQEQATSSEASFTCEEPRILSYHADRRSVTGGWERSSPHNGLDFEAEKGDIVRSAAVKKGRVAYIWGIDPSKADREDASCGLGIGVWHGAREFYTRYCHMDEVSVRVGEEVPYGKEIGKVGTSGNAQKVPHLHFELCVGQPCFGYFANTENPLPFLIGPYRPGVVPDEVLITKKGKKQSIVLTYPVGCSQKKP